jgi:hypothetical protein
MFKYLTLIFALVLGTTFLSASEGNAAQCIYNDSATDLKVTWYNNNAHKDSGSSNNSLSLGFQACQNNSNLGFAVIECNGCAWAEGSAKAAIIAAGIGAFGVCIVASGGECAAEFELFGAAVTEAVQAVPPAFNGKLVVVPDKGKTVKIGGNAFNLRVE